MFRVLEFMLFAVLLVRESERGELGFGRSSAEQELIRGDVSSSLSLRLDPTERQYPRSRGIKEI